MSCNQLAPRGDADVTISSHLPNGVAWIAFRMPGKLAYKLWTAFANAYDAMSEALCKAHTEIDPRATTELIGEWETALSLPDACLPSGQTLAKRRENVLFRLRFRRWTTAQDWHDLAALFGLRIVIIPGWYVQKPALYPISYPKRYDLFPKLGRFRVYIDVMNIKYQGYPYTYPFDYGGQDDRLTAFQCIIDRVRPANVIVIWNAFPEVPGECRHTGVYTDEFTDEFC